MGKRKCVNCNRPLYYDFDSDDHLCEFCECYSSEELFAVQENGYKMLPLER